MKNGSGKGNFSLTVILICNYLTYTSFVTNSYRCLVCIIVLQKADVPNGVAGNQPVAINMDQFHNQQYQNQMYEEQVSYLRVSIILGYKSPQASK